jgi:hypothetical protein
MSAIGVAKTAATQAERVAAIAAHPQMPEAMRLIASGLIDFFQGSRLLNLIASDRGRLVMAWMALYLDTGHDPRDPLSGLTVNRFKALCASTGVCSPGRSTAMLGIMRFAGYLEPAGRAHRGLPLRLIPTEKLRAQQRERWRRLFLALACVRPEGAIGLALIDEPAFHKAFIRASVEAYLSGQPPIAFGPALTLFADQKAGFMVLMSLMLSTSPEDRMPPSEPMSVPVARLARRFAVSRAQVKHTLRSAVAAGLLQPAGADQTAYLITPVLRESLFGFVAALLLLLADGIAGAQAELNGGAAPVEDVA